MDIEKHEKFIRDRVPVYDKKTSEMRRLIDEFEEKTAVGLWWDAKVYLFS